MLAERHVARTIERQAIQRDVVGSVVVGALQLEAAAPQARPRRVVKERVTTSKCLDLEEGGRTAHEIEEKQ